VFFLFPLGAIGSSVPELTWVCLFGGVVPSGGVVLYGAYRWGVERHLRALAALAQTYRRIKLDEFARRAGTTRLKSDRALAQAVKRGYVKGSVDRTSDEFVVQEAVAQQVFVAKCPTCGAQVDRWAFPEERVLCPYCGAGILVPPPGAAVSQATLR
jgi:DNA-directed RNA polymerase subunit RPC12/RpoP